MQDHKGRKLIIYVIFVIFINYLRYYFSPSGQQADKGQSSSILLLIKKLKNVSLSKIYDSKKGVVQ